MWRGRVRQYLKPYRNPALRPYFNPVRDWTRVGLKQLPFAAERFVANLQRLNDVLATTPLAEHYWLTGGLLLGWARERHILAWDVWDADFCYFVEHHPEFLQVVPALEQAGFRLLHSLRNNAGDITQYRFERAGIWFEFFETRRSGENLQNFIYGKWNGEWYELLCQFPAYRLERIEFLDRKWFKPADHATDLTVTYGNWRVPQRNFDFATDSPSVAQRALWSPGIQSNQPEQIS